MCSPEPASSAGPSDPPNGADSGWQVAIGLLTTWLGPGNTHPHRAVAQRLAELAEEGGPAVVERAALGLTDLAGMLLELYADHAGAPPDQVLQKAATLLYDRAVWD
jgi:hypothetical protein